MRWISVLLLLAAPVFPGEEIVKEKQDKPTPPKTAQLAPGILLPVAPGATLDKGDDPDRRVVVNLDANGQITIAGKRYSLDEFGAILKREARVLDEIEKRKGGSGMVELRAGVRASKM
ncbi:MAG: hypothetical protein ACYTGZ_22640, partial [Planctomycetota bacterium]